MSLDGMDSINKYLEEIKKAVESSGVDLNQYEVFYRGESKEHDTTTPGIFRDNYLENEHKIFRELELRYPNIFDNAKTTIDKLAIMQHYGLPTRLLDFTTNPLIALYMALDNHKVDKFSPMVKIVLVNKEKIKYYDSDTVTVLANFAKIEKLNLDFQKNHLYWIVEMLLEYFEVKSNYIDKKITRTRTDIDEKKVITRLSEHRLYDDTHEELHKVLKSLINLHNSSQDVSFIDFIDIAKNASNELKYALAEGLNYSFSHIHYLLHQIKAEKPYFKDMIWAEHFDKTVVFVKSKHSTKRVVNQAGLFALFGISEGQKKSFSLEKCKEREHFILKALKLSKIDVKFSSSEDSIENIKKALAVLGVTHDTVYPDIECSAKYIKEYFL
jgi:hypothetical protein